MAGPTVTYHTDPPPLDVRQEHVFLESLTQLGTAQRAANAIGVSARAAWHHRRNNPEFSARWNDAIQEFADSVLRGAAIDRAVEGVSEPIFGREGALLGEKVRYSDGLLTRLLEADDKPRYSPRTEITGAGGGPLEIDATPEHLLAQLDALLVVAHSRRAAARLDRERPDDDPDTL